MIFLPNVCFSPSFRIPELTFDLCVLCRNCMPDFGGEVIAEVLAQRALEKTIIPLIPITTSSQYRHTEQDRDYKNKVPHTHEPIN